jgi:hypothetical protein
MEFLQPILDAARDEAIKNMPTVMAALAAGVVTIIGVAVAIAKKLIEDAKLRIAAAAGVQLVEAKMQPAQPMPQNDALRASLKKEMADDLAASLLTGSPKKALAKLPKLVQQAWDDDDARQRASAPTSPETPNAKRDAL